MLSRKPRVKDKETREREILAAAKEIFFDKGFKNASMEEIAQMAGVSKGTVYLYFKNKEDLYLFLMLPVATEFNKRLRKFEKEFDNGKHRSGREIILGLFNIHYEVYKYDPDGIRAIHAFHQGDFIRGLPQETVDKFNQMAQDNFALTRRLLSKATELKLIRKANIIQLADVIFAVFNGVVQLEENKKRITKRDHTRETMELAFRLLADALCPKTTLTRSSRM